MDVIEKEIVFTTKDSSGNTVINYPLTTVEQVDGGVAFVNGISPDVNGNVEIDVGGMPIGFEYFQTNPNVQVGSLPLVGGLFSREIYFDLWEWVQKQSGYLITESEWQALAVANGGAVPFYSDGDGSTTFRVPALSVWCKGAGSIEEIGNYLADSFKGHKHNVAVTSTGETASAGAHTHTASTSSAGEHTHTISVNTTGYPDGSADSNATHSNYWRKVGYGNSSPSTDSAGTHNHTVTVNGAGTHMHTVTIKNSVTEDAIGSDETRPKTIVGIYCVIAFGSVASSGSVSLDAVQDVLMETQQTLVETERAVQQSLSKTENTVKEIIETKGLYKNYGDLRERNGDKPTYGLT